MIPFDHTPGAKQWAKGLPGLIAHGGPLWICGPYGSGVSTTALWLADQRGTEVIEYDLSVEVYSWLKTNPRGVVASESALGAAGIDKRYDFIELRLWPLDDDPSAIQACLNHMAEEEGVQPPFPPALTRLPCRGNLRELRNRLISWRLLGQLPEPEATGTGPELFEAEDIASNLHILERALLHRALRRSYGNRVEAAKRLGISRRQLYLLMGATATPSGATFQLQPA